MKRIVTFILVSFCLIFMNMTASMQKSTVPEEAILRLQKVNFKDIAHVLENAQELLKIIASNPDAQKKIATIIEPTIKIAELIDVMNTKILDDVLGAINAGKEFPLLFKCLKLSKAQINSKGQSEEAQKFLNVCKLKYANKPQAIQEGLKLTELLLKPLLEDFLLGWTDFDGTKHEGIVLSVLDMLNQQEMKKKIGTAVDDMRKILEFIEELKKIIQASELRRGGHESY